MTRSSVMQSWTGSFVIKLACFFALLFIVDIPIVSPVSVIAVLVLTAYLCIGELRAVSGNRTWTILAGSLMLWLTAALLPSSKIEEGHNLLLFVDEDSPALQQALPPDVYEWAKAQFHSNYPKDQRCRRELQGCWQKYGEVTRPFAFSADGALQEPLWSRQVSGFDFHSVATGRFGFLNSSGLGDTTTNWYANIGTHSDPTRTAAPYFVRYRFSDEFAGARICWQGTIAVQSAGRSFELSTASSERCLTLEAETLPVDVIGLQISSAAPLMMSFEATPAQSGWNALSESLRLGAALLLILGLFRSDAAVWIPTTLITTTSALMFKVGVLWNLHRYPLFKGGEDSLTHWGFGRWILEAAVDGDWHQALQGVEPVFYYMPGYRYLRALEMLVFGDSGMLSFAMLLITPAIVYLLARKLVPILPSLLISAAVLITRSYPDKVNNLAESVAYPLALTGLLSGLHSLALQDQDYSIRRWLFVTALLLAIAVLLRPNLLPAAGLYLAFVWWRSLPHGFWTASLPLGFGFCPSLLLLVHNLYFGGEWVLLTKARDITVNLQTPPALYLEALQNLFTGNLQAAPITKVTAHLSNWLTIGGGIYLLLAGGILAFIALALGASGRWSDFVRLTRSVFDEAVFSIVVFCAGLQGVLLFYQSAGRYSLLAQFTTMILLIVLLWRIQHQARQQL